MGWDFTPGPLSTNNTGSPDMTITVTVKWMVIPTNQPICEIVQYCLFQPTLPFYDSAFSLMGCCFDDYLI